MTNEKRILQMTMMTMMERQKGWLQSWHPKKRATMMTMKMGQTRRLGWLNYTRALLKLV